MKWIIIIMILSIGIFYACTPTKKPTETSTPEATPKLEGKLEGSWMIQKVICCGRRKTEQMGRGIKNPKQLVFATNNQVTITDLRTKSSKTITYQLETKSENGTTTTYITLEPNKPKGILRLNGDELIIDYEYMDLQKEFYRR